MLSLPATIRCCLICLAAAGWCSSARAQIDAPASPEDTAAATAQSGPADEQDLNGTGVEQDRLGGDRNHSDRGNPAVSEAAEAAAGTLPILAVPAERIREAIESSKYVLFPRAGLPQLSPPKERRPESVQSFEPSIALAKYRAVLTGDSLRNGTLQLQLNPAKSADSYVLGRTNLNELEFRLDGNPISSAAMADGRLSLLTVPRGASLDASWSARGNRNSEGVVFALQLPPAAVTELRLRTNTNVRVTSSNAVVRSESVGTEIRWTLFPRAGHTVTFLCESNTDSGENALASVLSVDTTLRVSKHTVFVDWTMVVPPELDDAVLAVAVSSGCRIQDVRSETGNRISWKLMGEDDRRLVLSGLQAGRTVTVHGVSESRREDALVLPLLADIPQEMVRGVDFAVRLRSTGLRLIVNPGLAVVSLNLHGLYQQEVSFNATGEQVIELRQFAENAEASIHVEPSSAALRQKLLISRSAVTPGLVTVYAELEPRSDHQTYRIEWNLSGPWQPASVTELHSGLPVYSHVGPSADGTGRLLQIELRSAATSIEPARLRIEFRSTQAITPQTSLLPILVNESFRSDGTWILSAATAPFPDNGQAEEISDIEAELQDEFLWLIDDLQLPEPTRLQMTKTDRLSASADSTQAPEPAIPRATLDYQLLLTETQVTEDIQLRLASDDQLPESMTLLFPEGIDVRLAESSSTQQLSPTGRRTDDHWQEWLLAIPRSDSDSSTCSINLRISRLLTGAKFAAFPRLPNTSDVTLTALSVTDTESGFAPAALVSEPSESGESESFLLAPDIPVSVNRITDRFRLRFTRTSIPERFLGIRGTAWIIVSPRLGDDRYQGLADLVVSRTGPVESLTVHWPDASGTEVFIDDQRVSFPVVDSTTRILLPPDRTTAGIRILWTGHISKPGWINQFSTITLPRFDAVTNLDLAQFLQLPPGYNSRAAPIPGFARNSGTDFPRSPQLTTSNAAIRDFQNQWRLADELGAASIPCIAENDDVVVRIISLRWLLSGSVLSFWFVIATRRFLSGFRLRTMVALMLSVAMISAFGSPVTEWLLLGVNLGFALLLALRIFRQPPAILFRRLLLPPDRHADSTVSAVTTAMVALVLTGQAPPNSDDPPVLINEEAQATSPFVFVRKDLLPTAADPLESDVRVLDVAAQVHVEQGGGTEVSVDATVACRLTDHTARFTLPVETATLTKCSLDGTRIAPVSGPQGRPQVRIRTPPLHETTGVESPSEWVQYQVSYTLRTEVTRASGRFNVRVPLPFSVRSQLTLDTVGDHIHTARLSDSESLSVESSQVTFPVQYNRGPLDIVIETQLSHSGVSETSSSTTVICRAETMENHTTLTCRYRLTAEQPALRELFVPRIPGFQAGSARSHFGTPLQLSVSEDFLVLRGNQEELSDVQVTWESPEERMTVDRVIPSSALATPVGCTADRILLAVQAPAPLHVQAAVLAGTHLSEVNPGDNERALFQLTANDQVFAVDSLPDDIHLRLGMQTTRRVALSMIQKLEVGVEQVDWFCRSDMKITGPDTFRQRILVPPELLIDRVDVSAEGASRLRSWSCRDGLLLLTFREGTGGNYQLSFSGIVPIPRDGRIQLAPVQLESTDIVDSTLDLYSRPDATVRLENDGGSILPPYPERLTRVDPSQPLKLSTGPQHRTSARLMVLASKQTDHLHCDAAVRIQAGDQDWNGRVRLPDEFSDVRTEWVTADSTRTELIDAGDLPSIHLRPGQASTLMLQGVRIPVSGTSIRIPLPILDPEVSIDRLQVFRRVRNSDSAEPSDTQWMLSSLARVSPVPPRTGMIQLDQHQDDDTQENIIRVAAIQPEDSSVSASPVRRAARCFAVTTLYPAHGLISGTTDIVIEFGRADETLCVIPPNIKVLSCRLDGAQLPHTVSPKGIPIQRESPVQRLTLDWIIHRRDPGYLPFLEHLLTPLTQAIEHVHFVAIHDPDDQSWSAGKTLTKITFAQLQARITAAYSESGTQDKRAATRKTIARYLSDMRKTLTPPKRIFESTAETVAVTSRRRLPWPHWIPIIVLTTALLMSASHQMLQRFSPETWRTSDSHASGQVATLSDEQSDVAPSSPA